MVRSSVWFGFSGGRYHLWRLGGTSQQSAGSHTASVLLLHTPQRGVPGLAKNQEENHARGHPRRHGLELWFAGELTVEGRKKGQ